MNGLILSKHAHEYAQRARACDADFNAWTMTQSDAVWALSAAQLRQIQWMLAEPALAVSVLDALPNLRWLQSTWAGVETLLMLPRRDYVLSNIRGVFAPLMSEYVLAHLLAHERQLLAHHVAQQHRRWFNDSTGAQVGSLRGKSVLILGMGSIGAGLARVLRFLDMRVLGVVTQRRAIAECDAVGTLADLGALLTQADYVVNTLPNTSATSNLVNADFLRQMRRTAVFINVGRGQAVVERDLAQALDDGRIAGAVLDVYRDEPLPADHFFWHTANLTLTSHTAAPSFPDDIFKVFWDNYTRYTRGQAVRCVVDFEKGY